jgi:hypothetical protein
MKRRGSSAFACTADLLGASHQRGDRTPQGVMVFFRLRKLLLPMMLIGVRTRRPSHRRDRARWGQRLSGGSYVAIGVIVAALAAGGVASGFSGGGGGSGGGDRPTASRSSVASDNLGAAPATTPEPTTPAATHSATSPAAPAETAAPNPNPGPTTPAPTATPGPSPTSPSPSPSSPSPSPTSPSPSPPSPSPSTS